MLGTTPPFASGASSSSVPPQGATARPRCMSGNLCLNLTITDNQVPIDFRLNWERLWTGMTGGTY